MTANDGRARPIVPGEPVKKLVTRGSGRDHLFISYAWEDGAVAEWLARKLAASGYAVWIDRFKMLGGERWPKDIDRAIRERTFRMIALLSRSSLEKPNPCKERQQAIALSRERNENDFLIPLNLEGLKPTELGWELSDLNYIDFRRWGDGFTQLQRKLESIHTPRPLGANGPAAAVATYASSDVLRTAQEKVFANCLEVTVIPDVIHRFRLQRPLLDIERRALQELWAFEPVGDSQALAFIDPPKVAVENCSIMREPGASWRDVDRIDGIRSSHVVTSLLKKSLSVKCIERGLVRSEDGGTHYFPPGLLPKERLAYRNYKGANAWVGVLGERRFGKGRSRYQLGVTFWVRSDVLQGFVVETKIRLHITDPSGRALDQKSANARRKKIAKSWWNHDWLSRQLAIVHFLADHTTDRSEIVVGTTPGEQVKLSGQLLQAFVSPSINDAALEPLRAAVEATNAAGADDDPDAPEDVVSGWSEVIDE